MAMNIAASRESRGTQEHRFDDSRSRTKPYWPVLKSEANDLRVQSLAIIPCWLSACLRAHLVKRPSFSWQGRGTCDGAQQRTAVILAERRHPRTLVGVARRQRHYGSVPVSVIQRRFVSSGLARLRIWLSLTRSRSPTNQFYGRMLVQFPRESFNLLFIPLLVSCSIFPLRPLSYLARLASLHVCLSLSRSHFGRLQSRTSLLGSLSYRHRSWPTSTFTKTLFLRSKDEIRVLGRICDLRWEVLLVY